MKVSQLMKKICAVAFCAAMVGGSAVTILPAVSSTNSGSVASAVETYSDFGYFENDDCGITITGYSGSDAEVVIPSEIDGKSVTSIGYKAFEGCTNLTSITIPDSVMSIGWDAFGYNDFDNIENFTIYGKTGSVAETYAKENEFKFVSTGIARILATSIKLNNTTVNLETGKTATLTATITPENATDKTVTWTTSDKKVVTVEDGKVTAVAAGTATITAKTSNDKIATCKVTVVPLAAKVTLSKTSATLNKGSTLTLTATVTPTNAADKTVTWSSSNTKSATVTSNGKITAKEVGTTTITAKTSNGKTATCKVTVKNPTVSVTSVKLNKTSVTLGKAETYTINGTIAPSNATNKTIKWSTSNSKVATVNSSGKITSKGTGTATITAKTVNGKTATCKVTVKKAPSKITLNKSSTTIGVGKTETLKKTLPSGSASNKVTYTTSNTKVATVNSSGKITAKKVGTATITVRTFNGKTESCKVTVKKLPTKVTLNKTSATVKKGNTLTLKATISPNKDVISKVTWSTSDSKIATVKNGKVITKKDGTVTITVKTTNGKTATCKVTVRDNTAAPTGKNSYTFILNTKTKVYHTHSCAAVSKMSAENKLVVTKKADTLAQACALVEADGYRLCKRC